MTSIRTPAATTAPLSATGAQPAPVDLTERVADLDVLRGVALFGVFLVNMVGFADGGMMATSDQLAVLRTAPVDSVTMQVVIWWFGDKANSIFAFLFGLGFYFQMTRLEGRGLDFQRIYLRRLTVLLGLGILNLYFFWAWDILQTYALAGFLLLAFRRSSNRTLLVTGVTLALLSRTVHEALLEFTGLGHAAGRPDFYSDAFALARQRLSQAGDYAGLVRAFAQYTWVEYLVNGAWIAWMLYALGRFLLGAWVGRHGWLQRAETFLPGFRRIMRLTLPAGLIGEGIARLLRVYSVEGYLPAWPHWEFVVTALHLTVVPVLSVGYLCAIVVGLHSQRGRRLLTPFGYAGRMALTNYLTQTLVYGFVLFRIGPGLGLAGHIGTTAVVGIVIVAYAGQVWISRWWLSRYRYGPFEWLWRALTYGRRPGWVIAG
jgi:uncharacterized protein